MGNSRFSVGVFFEMTRISSSCWNPLRHRNEDDSKVPEEEFDYEPISLANSHAQVANRVLLFHIVCSHHAFFKNLSFSGRLLRGVISAAEWTRNIRDLFP